MKPDTNPPGTIFNFDAITMWIYPDVWDENKEVKLRGLWFVFLYALTTCVFAALFFVPMAIFSGSWLTIFLVWLMFALPGGVLLGLAVWWDFTKRVRKINGLKK